MMHWIAVFSSPFPFFFVTGSSPNFRVLLMISATQTQIPLRLAPHRQNEEGPRTRPRAEPAEAARRRRPGAAAAAAGSGRRRRRTGQPTAASAAPQRRRPPRRCPCWERTDAAAETVAGGAGPHCQELPAGEGAGESWVLVLVGPGWGWVPRARKTEGPSLLGVEAAGWTRSIYLATILTVSVRRDTIGSPNFHRSWFLGFD